MDLHIYSVAPGRIERFTHARVDLSFRSHSVHWVDSVQVRQGHRTSVEYHEFVTVGNRQEIRSGTSTWPCYVMSLPSPPPFTVNMHDNHLRASVTARPTIVDRVQVWALSVSTKGVPVTRGTSQGNQTTGAKLFISRSNATLVRESTSFYTHSKGQTSFQMWTLDDSMYGRPVRLRLPAPCPHPRFPRIAAISFTSAEEVNPFRLILEYALASDSQGDSHAGDITLLPRHVVSLPHSAEHHPVRIHAP